MPELPPQPPPDEPAPPPGPAARRSWRIAGFLILLLVIATGYFGHHAYQEHQAARRSASLGRMKEVGSVLLAFDTENGTFPDGGSLKDICDATGLPPWPLVTSNDYFRQMVVVGMAKEEIFADGVKQKADGVTTPLSKILEGGECSWGYIPWSSSGEPSRVVLVYPMVPGTRRMDPGIFGGKGFILRLDNSVTVVNIEKNGTVLQNGKDLFDPSQPMWDGKLPDLKWPAPK
jgi:hypothetical protein